MIYPTFPPHLASKLWTAGKPIIVFISENKICAGPPVLVPLLCKYAYPSRSAFAAVRKPVPGNSATL